MVGWNGVDEGTPPLRTASAERYDSAVRERALFRNASLASWPRPLWCGDGPEHRDSTLRCLLDGSNMALAWSGMVLGPTRSIDLVAANSPDSFERECESLDLCRSSLRSCLFGFRSEVSTSGGVRCQGTGSHDTYQPDFWCDRLVSPPRESHRAVDCLA